MIEKYQTAFQHNVTVLPTIMIVTDNLTLLKLVQMTLELELGCDVLGFVSANSAKETAKFLKPDLVIVDEQLRGGNAHAFSHQLHNIEGLSQVPILFINALDVDVAHRQSDRTRFLKYPWKVEAFYTAVQQLLGHDS